jgi:protein TonB
MFEGSLVESRRLIASKTQKWTALGSLALQCAIAAVLIAIPVIRPEVLPIKAPPPQITVPDIRPVQIVQHIAETAATAAAAMTARAPAPAVENTRSLVFPLAPVADVAPVNTEPMPMGNGPASLAPLAAIASSSSGPAIAVRPRENRPVHVSSGVVSGMLLSPITPVYPPIAKAVHVEGSVVMEAVISKTGHIESLNVVSGPEMLRQAALEAVERARYAPYKLNGDPVDVQTVITVVFRLGS